MKTLYILKLGGSVITHKDRQRGQLRKTLLKKIAQEIYKSSKKGYFNLILIHGAGSTGHQLAHRYKLAKGASKTRNGWKGSFISRTANQKMNVTISEIFIKNKLPVVSIHTSSVIIQNNKKIAYFDTTSIKESLKQNCIPILYGEMVFDKKLGMSICSGDAIVSYLAKKLDAKKIFFASDIDGVFDKDPYIFKEAQLIEKATLKNICKKSSLTESHNIDTTGGIVGKVEKIKNLQNSKVKTIEIFNGLKEENYGKIISGRNFKHTEIKI